MLVAVGGTRLRTRDRKMRLDNKIKSRRKDVQKELKGCFGVLRDHHQPLGFSRAIETSNTTIASSTPFGQDSPMSVA